MMTNESKAKREPLPKEVIEMMVEEHLAGRGTFCILRKGDVTRGEVHPFIPLETLSFWVCVKRLFTGLFKRC